MRRLMPLLGALLAAVPAPAAGADRTAGPLAASRVSDGSGGVIVVWDEWRGGDRNLYAQRLDTAGARQWGADGVVVCGAATDQARPQLAPDGAGGAVIAWEDERTGAASVYAQRLDAAGQAQWTPDGVAVTLGPATEFLPHVAADGAGGAFVSWFDTRDPFGDVYAQRLSATGARAWGDSGLAVATLAGGESPGVVVADGAGGCIIAWMSPLGSGMHNRAQRFDGGGTKLWAPPGVAPFGFLHEHPAPVVTDGQGGAIFAVSDLGSTNGIVYVQRVRATGTLAWTTGSLATGPGWRRVAAAAADGLGGAVLAWSVLPVSGDRYLVTQRVDSSRTVLWGVGTVTRSGSIAPTGSNPFDEVTLAADGTGGAFAVWRDFRAGYLNPDLYAQHLAPGGAPSWAGDGIPVCAAAGSQVESGIAPAPGGAVIVTWKDFRSDSNSDSTYFAQKLFADGTVGWALDGTLVESYPAGMVRPIAAARAGGGSFLAWEEVRDGTSRVLARALDADGAPAGPTIPVCDAPGRQTDARIADDGAGGAFVLWRDHRADASGDLYAQRVIAAGGRLWGAAGAAVCTAPTRQANVSVAGDGADGLLVAWEDQRVSTVHWNVYAQRLDPAGVALWTADGVPFLATLAVSAWTPSVVPDGAGGAIVGYSSNDGGGGYTDLHAKRIGWDGMPMWTSRLTPVSGTPGAPVGLPDGVGGAYFAWQTADRYLGSDILAQRLNSEGFALWGPGAASVCAASGDQLLPKLVPGGGGVIVGWHDTRAANSADDVYAQKLDDAGVALWTANGVPVCAAAGMQRALAMAPDGDGGSVLAWLDPRQGAADVFAQRISAAGSALWLADGVALTSGALAGAVAIAPAGGGVTTAFQDRVEPRGARVIVRQVGADGGATDGEPVTGVRPRAAALALAVLAGPGAPRLAYRVADASHARLELFDLAGRRRGARALAAGARGEIALRELAWVPAGLYFAALTQDGTRLARRLIVTR